MPAPVQYRTIPHTTAQEMVANEVLEVCDETLTVHESATTKTSARGGEAAGGAAAAAIAKTKTAPVARWEDAEEAVASRWYCRGFRTRQMIEEVAFWLKYGRSWVSGLEWGKPIVGLQR